MSAHVQLEPAVGVHVGPEQRAQGPAVFVSQPAGPRRVLQHLLDEKGVHVDERRLKEVQSQHRNLLVLAVRARQLAVLPEEQVGIRGVPVLDDLEALVDLPA